MPVGALIAIYGINNLGKSTQAKKLVEAIRKKQATLYKKYAIYDLEPSGPILNDYLRNGNPLGLSHREFKIFHVLNRTQFDHNLRELVKDTIVVAEDYVGTSIAWGVGSGVDRGFIELINSHLLKPDISILLDGERFPDGIEEGHKHESDNDLTEKVRQVHLDLARDYGWVVINANQSIEEVHQEIFDAIEPLLHDSEWM